MMGAPVLPGAAVGILGSGQLGRMLALAARRLGYRLRRQRPVACPLGEDRAASALDQRGRVAGDGRAGR